MTSFKIETERAFLILCTVLCVRVLFLTTGFPFFAMVFGTLTLTVRPFFLFSRTLFFCPGGTIGKATAAAAAAMIVFLELSTQINLDLLEGSSREVQRQREIGMRTGRQKAIPTSVEIPTETELMVALSSLYTEVFVLLRGRPTSHVYGRSSAVARTVDGLLLTGREPSVHATDYCVVSFLSRSEVECSKTTNEQILYDQIRYDHLTTNRKIPHN